MVPLWSQATIVVIHKDGKDPTKCQSYRPISLLNTDLRILTAILARRVIKIITEIIHPDQTGLIKGQYYGDNIRRLLNLMTHPKVKEDDSMISLDAMKACDRVPWQYLTQTLKNFNLAQTSWNGYKPQSAVKVRSFHFGMGCRQGCPLSPLLFNINIGPLAQLIRDNENIKGIMINREQHKM